MKQPTGGEMIPAHEEKTLNKIVVRIRESFSRFSTTGMSQEFSKWLVNGLFTLSETNIAPENRPLEKEIPIGNHRF